MRENNKREMSFESVSATIIRETEKAYQAEVLYWTSLNQPNKKAKMWVPKSCSKVENSNLIEVATFILRKWEEEHRQAVAVHSGLAAKKMRIEWDIEAKERLIKREADERKAYWDNINNRVANYLPKATESSNRLFAIIGLIAKTYGRIWKEEGTNPAACDELINWGKKVAKQYGQAIINGKPYDEEECYKLNKAYDAKNRSFVLNYGWDYGALGDFRYDKSEEWIGDVNTTLMKHFKKEETLLKEYRSFTEKFYELNGKKY